MCFDDPNCPHLYFAEKKVSFALRFVKEKNGEYELAIPSRMSNRIHLTDTDVEKIFNLFHGCLHNHNTETGMIGLYNQHPNAEGNTFGLIRPNDDQVCLIFLSPSVSTFGSFKHTHPLMSMYQTPDMRVVCCS